MSRLVSLKSEHKQLKSDYNNLMQLYECLKHGSASEVSAIIERIKSSDGILDMSEQRSRLSPSLHDPRLAGDAAGFVDQNTKAHNDSADLSEQKTLLALNQTSKSSASYTCESRYLDSILSAFSRDDNGCHSDLSPSRLGITLRHIACTSAEQNIAVGFSPQYEPLLRGLLSSNIAKVRQGFLILQSWNVEIRKIHDTEQFDSLFSVLRHEEDAYIPRSRLCEMCAVAATSGQYVRHLLAPGLINYWYGKFRLGVLVNRMCQF